ncbi:MAG: hypothetical protein JXP34_22195 [Planctomycetes bacterium]|nr:hypothetical protein [Planctomycetota bacterium]
MGLGLAIAFAVAAAPGDAGGYAVALFPGHDGVLAPSVPGPVTALVRGPEGSARARLILIVGAPGAEGQVFRRDIDIGPVARRIRVAILTPSFPFSIAASLRVGGKEVARDRQVVAPASPEVSLIGVRGLELPDLPPAEAKRFRIVRISDADIAGLRGAAEIESFAAIFIDPRDIEGLADARRALRDYVLGGGSLIASTCGQAMDCAALLGADVAPVRATRIPAPEGAQPASGLEADVEGEYTGFRESPLAWSACVGAGRATILALDPGKEPFRSAPDAWMRLFSFIDPPRAGEPAALDPTPWPEMRDLNPPVDGAGVAFILLIYGVMIAAGDALLVRRLRRPAATFLTSAAAAGLFVIGVAIAARLTAEPDRLAAVAIGYGGPGKDAVRFRAIVGCGVSLGGTYAFRLEGGDPFLAPLGGTGAGLFGGDAAEIEEGREATTLWVRLNPQSRLLLLAEWTEVRPGIFDGLDDRRPPSFAASLLTGAVGSPGTPPFDPRAAGDRGRAIVLSSWHGFRLPMPLQASWPSSGRISATLVRRIRNPEGGDR